MSKIRGQLFISRKAYTPKSVNYLQTSQPMNSTFGSGPGYQGLIASLSHFVLSPSSGALYRRVICQDGAWSISFASAFFAVCADFMKVIDCSEITMLKAPNGTCVQEGEIKGLWDRQVAKMNGIEPVLPGDEYFR